MPPPFTTFPIPTTDINQGPVIATGSTTARVLADRFGTTIDPADYGALYDGSDDTDAYLAALAELENKGGGIFFLEEGASGISSELVANVPIQVWGSGRDVCTLFALTDTSIFRITQPGSSVRDVNFSGSQDFGAANPVFTIDQGCNNNQIEHCFFQYGKYAFLNKGTDNYIFNCEMRYPYGGANVKACIGDGNFWIRNKMDQVWPFAMPNMGTAPPVARQNTHAYAQGAVVTLSGWYLQKVNAGTQNSGGSAPALKGYEQSITDGSVVWNIVAPVGSYSFQMDSGALENFMIENDHSCSFDYGIGMTDTGEDGGSGAPQTLHILHAIGGQYSTCALRLTAGSRVIMGHSELACGWLNGGNATVIQTEGGFQGYVKIVDNQFFGGNSTAQCAKFFTTGAQTMLQFNDNQLVGSFDKMLNWDTGSGTFQTIMAVGNQAEQSCNISIGSGTNRGIVTNNDLSGGSVSNSGTNITANNNI